MDDLFVSSLLAITFTSAGGLFFFVVLTFSSSSSSTSSSSKLFQLFLVSSLANEITFIFSLKTMYTFTSSTSSILFHGCFSFSVVCIFSTRFSSSSFLVPVVPVVRRLLGFRFIFRHDWSSSFKVPNFFLSFSISISVVELSKDGVLNQRVASRVCVRSNAHFVVTLIFGETTAQFRYDFIQNARAINNINSSSPKSRNPKTKERRKTKSDVSESHPKSTTRRRRRRRVDDDAVFFSGFYGTERKI